jgi:D-amino-acid dehydrogenase
MFQPESPFYVRPTLDPELLAWGWRFWRASNAARAKRAGPLLRDLHRASKLEYQALAARLGNPFDLQESGLLMLCSTEEGLEAEAKTAARALTLGMPAQILGRSEVRAMQPGVMVDAVGGVYYPEDARLDPALLMRTLQDEARNSGVAFRWGACVERLERTSDEIRRLHLIEDDDGSGPPASSPRRVTLEADDVVLAAGVWSERLARSAGLRLPMRAGKGYSLTLSAPSMRPSTPAILSEGHVALAPMGTGVRFGGTMEVTGLREGVSESRVRGIKRSVQRVFPDLGEEAFAGVVPWYGFRPTSPDGLPYVGRYGGVRNLVVATGHAMIGVSLAPATGRLVGELLLGGSPSHPLEALSPDRYA